MVKQKNLEIVEYHKIMMPELIKDAESLVQDMRSSGKTTVLSAIFDATHSGRLTNMRVYPGKEMRDSVSSFVTPSPKPVLKHHNSDADPVGRINSAKFVQLKFGKDFDEDYRSPRDDAGSGFIQLETSIMDKDTIEKILDGRLQDLSTSGSISALKCSICGEDKLSSKSECDHWPGRSYSSDSSDEEYLCYMITGKLSYNECSLVSVPADPYAGISSLKLKQGEDSLLMSSYDSLNSNIGSLILSDGKSKGLQLIKGVIQDQVTAVDRKELTGKTIIAVSPNFKVKQNELHKESSMKTETKNTDVSAASTDVGQPTQASKANDSKEGVVAPEKTSNASQTVGAATLSDKAKDIAIETMAKSLEDANRLAKEAQDELGRVKLTLKDKDAEIEQLRVNGAQLVADMKQSYANMLLNTQLLLKKPLVASVKDQEGFDGKIKEYSERSVDSLKDSLKDLVPEMSALKDSIGIRTTTKLVEDKKIENVVANSGANTKDKETEGVSKKHALETFLNN